MTTLFMPWVTLLVMSVSDFDVVIDGKVDNKSMTDCTDQLQAAVLKAGFNNYPNDGSYVLAQTAPCIKFPSGVYIISKPIKFMPIARIEGRDAIIIQTGNCQSFVFNGGTKVRVTGIDFVGGTNAIWIDNPNVNGSLMDVIQCTFDNTSDYAVVLRGSRTPTDNTLSATACIERCRFRSCRQALCTDADDCFLEKNWIQWTQQFVPAGSNLECIYQRRGRLYMNGDMLIPDEIKAKPINQTWVKSNGSMSATKVTFSGENGGIPVVRCTSFPMVEYPYMGASYEFTSCQLSGGPSANVTSRVATFVGLPAVFAIEKCTHLIDIPIIVDEGSALRSLTDRTVLGKVVRIKPQISLKLNQAWPALDDATKLRIPSGFVQYTTWK